MGNHDELIKKMEEIEKKAEDAKLRATGTIQERMFTIKKIDMIKNMALSAMQRIIDEDDWESLDDFGDFDDFGDMDDLDDLNF